MQGNLFQGYFPAKYHTKGIPTGRPSCYFSVVKMYRSLLFWLSLIGLNSAGRAQYPSVKADSAFVKFISSLPGEEPFDSAHVWKRTAGNTEYIFSDNDLYRLFGYRVMTAYRDFDFKQQHILGLRTCKQCFIHCRHDLGRTSCHRNAHSLQWIWLVRDNGRAFIKVSSVTEKGHTDTEIPGLRKEWLQDTVLPRKSWAGQKAWYTLGGGDCHARISYTVHEDRYYPVYLLKEWNQYGGCRAGGIWAFTISFRDPGRDLEYIKRTILLDRDEEPYQ